MKILFVCSSNICRSPYCEYLLKRMAKEDKELSQIIEKVSSAAVLNQSFKIHPKAVVALKREGFSEEEIYAHKPRFKWCAWKDFKEADLIIGMNNANRFFTPIQFKKKFQTLSFAATGEEVFIEDPWLMKDINDYLKVMDTIKNYLVKFVENLKKSAQNIN